ncbi:MAG: hypothetical protein ACRCXE_01830, partial [Metamycoplasmataceae bacterium]
TLQKLFNFNELTEEVVMNAVDVTMHPMEGNEPRRVTLTARPGYSIIDGEEEGSILRSDEFTIRINYVIDQIVLPPTIDIKPSEIEGQRFKDYSVLVKLFAGRDFNVDNLANLDINLITVVEDLEYRIGLSPEAGYSINGTLETFSSDKFTLTFENIEIERTTTVPLNITLSQISNPTFIQGYDFLDKLFELQDKDQQWINDNLIASANAIVEGETYTIILSTNSIDKRINGEKTFESNEFHLVVNLDITKIAPQGAITIDDITPEKLNKLETLQKLFTFDSTISQNLIDESLDVILLTPADENRDRYAIELKAKPGYTINNISGLTSFDFDPVVIPPSVEFLNIRAHDQMGDIVITTLDIDDNNLVTVQTLSKLFSNISEEYLTRITVELKIVGESEFYTIEIKPQPGFMFENEQNEIESLPFVPLATTR